MFIPSFTPGKGIFPKKFSSKFKMYEKSTRGMRNSRGRQFRLLFGGELDFRLLGDSWISFYFGRKNFHQKLSAGKILAETVSTVQNGNSKDDIFHLIFWPK
jgi:hypothetical protein